MARLRLAFVMVLMTAGGAVSGFGFQDESLGPIQIEARAFETVRDFDYIKAQGDVVARYGEQTVQAQELVFEKQTETQWRLSADTDVSVEDPSFLAKARRVEVDLTRTETAYEPQQAVLLDLEATLTAQSIALQAESGRLSFLRQTLSQITLERDVVVRGEGFSLSAGSLTLTLADDAQWQVVAHSDVQFEGADQTLQGAGLELWLRANSAEDAQLERAVLSGFSGSGSFVNQEGKTHDIRYQGQTAELVFEQDTLARLELEGAQLTTCTCADTIARASYSLSGGRITLWPDEWVLGRDLMLKLSGVPVFWLPVFFAPLQDIDLDRFDYLPTIGRDAQRGWFAQWRLPLFVDPGNRGTVSLDYFNRYTETGLGVDWNYALAMQSQSGSFGIYHLVGRSEVLDLNWRHRWALPGLAELDWGVDRRQVRPAADAPSRLAYHLNAVGRLATLQWQVRTAREEVSQENESTDETPRYRVLERLPELSVSHTFSDPALPVSLSSQLSWGRYSEQRDADVAFVTRDRVDASLQAVLNTVTVQSASLRFDARGGLRYSGYGEQQQRTSTQLNLSAGWTPAQAFSAQAQYNVRSVNGQSPFAFDELEVSDALSGQLNFSLAQVRGALTGGYQLQAQRLDPISLTLSTTIAGYSFQSVLRTAPQTLDLDIVQLQAGWRADWGQLTVAGGYSFAEQNYDDVIVRLSLEAVRLGARIDPNRLQLKRTNAEFDLRLGAWSLDFNGEYDWLAQRFSALQVGLFHHFCKDCWQAGVYLSGQRIWLQAQINAFPGVGLNYSPTDGALCFSEPAL